MGDEPSLEVPPHWAALYKQGNEFESKVFQVFQKALGDECVNLDSNSFEESMSMSEHIALTVAAMNSGRKVILGGYLPDDLVGGRRGKPDILLRGMNQADGRPSYYAADVKFHSVIRQHKVKTPQSVFLSWPDRPFIEDAFDEVGWTLDESHVSDWLQLAHYQRMLQTMGFAAPENWAALIGADTVNDREMALVWIRLDGKTIKSYSETEDVVERNILEEYDYQFSLRKEIARIALRQVRDDTPAPLVEPIYQLECEACSWREACPERLVSDEATWKLRIGSENTRREWELLRAHGVSTIEEVARLQPDGEIVADIAARVHTPGRAKQRLMSYQRKADMVHRGVQIERITKGEINVPTFDVEVDFDIEWLHHEPPYLYGFLLQTPDASETYYHISAFEHLTVERGQELARDAVQWLINQRDMAKEQGQSFGVFHYSHPEKTELRKALGSDAEKFERLIEESFVDLAPIVRKHFYGVQGLGLKQIAVHGSGFAWRDETPGGLNSQIWAEEAIEGSEGSRKRVLAYNEDDVRATAIVRNWLRKSQPELPSSIV